MGGPIAVRTATVASDSPHRLITQTQARFLIAIAENDEKKDPEVKATLRTAYASSARKRLALTIF